MRESRHQHTPVPLLLSSFPAPPSFIPPSPNPSILSTAAHPPIATPSSSSPNPPPSLPPSSPLPPLPGKSPLSDVDTLLFHSHSSPRISRASILSISTASSNRRLSSTSATSPSTRSPRDSVASNSSTSARSTRSFSASSTTPSYSSSTSSTAPPRTPSIAFSISEEAGVDELGAIIGRRVDIVTSPESHDVLPDITAFSRSPLSKPKPLLSNSLSNLKNATSPPPSSFSLPRPPSSSSKSSKSSKQRSRTRDRSNTATSTSTTMSNTSTSIPTSNPSQSLLSLSSSTSLLSSSVTSLLLASDSIQDDDADNLDSILRTHSVGNESLVDGAYGGILLGDGDDGGEDSDLEFVLNHSRLGLESRETFADGGQPVEEDGGDAEALALHRSFRAKRSRSGSHRLKLNSAQGPQGQDLDTVVPPVPSIPIIPNTPQTPHTHATHAHKKSGGDSARERGRRAEEGGRSSSPEIGEILASTPRPARSKSRPRVGQSGGSKSAPGSRRGSAANSASISRSTSIASAASMSKSLSRSASRSTTSTASVLSASTSRTSRSTGGGGVVDLDTDEFGFIGAYMSDGGDEDGAGSDSSLDLHTPLPHLMVKHGMLSPNSKLLPAGMSPFAMSFGDAGASTTSLSTTNSPANASTSKGKGGKGAGNGLLKDERDTVKRRTRHRDGSLLRGGIGLTTGLGWSDSEDEDAPSPLTRRLSTLNMSRSPSAASMRSTGSMGSMRSIGSIGMGRVHSMGSMGNVGKGGKRHPLSRSYSSPNDGMLLERDEHEYGEGNARYDEFGYPTEGGGHNEYGNESEYGQDWGDGDLNEDTEVYQSFDYPRRSGESASRITTSMSLGAKTRTGSGSGAVNGSKVGAMRMSSSLSGKGKGGLGFVNRDKGLPPLPPLSRQASSASVKSTTTPVPANHAHTTASVGGNRIPRPLQLPRHSSMRSGNGNGGIGGGDRSPVPVPSVPSSSPAVLTSYSQRSNTLGRSFGSGVSVASGHNGTGTGNVGLSASMSKSSVTLSTPASGESAIGKPKPRTGTGMIYRSSVTSRMRVPSAPMLGRAVGVGGAGQKTAVL